MYDRRYRVEESPLYCGISLPEFPGSRQCISHGNMGGKPGVFSGTFKHIEKESRFEIYLRPPDMHLFNLFHQSSIPGDGYMAVDSSITDMLNLHNRI